MSSESLEILVIEDDPLVQASLKVLLTGHRLTWYSSWPRFQADGDYEGRPDLILLDLRSPDDPQGTLTLEGITSLRRRYPRSQLMIASGVADVAIMRTCIQRGAERFLFKENLLHELPTWIAGLKEMQQQRRDLEKLLVGGSLAIGALRDELLNLRFQGSDVLLEGETGSGKELCARALHSDGPFVAVNASAVPAELFESEFFGAEKGAYSGANQARIGHMETAGHGTLFLDEVQSLAPLHQAKLLRVLETRSFQRVGSSQERPFRARLICASNRSLRELSEGGLFREDLYFRLAPVCLHVPPLRQRSEDIPLLAELFFEGIANGCHQESHS